MALATTVVSTISVESGSPRCGTHFSYIYVAIGVGLVSVIDRSTVAVVSTISVGPIPMEWGAIFATTNRIYVLIL